ncbi:MAG: hypothetical protein AB7Q76_01075 [Gammaproteobacteria bacterium]
MRRSIKALAVTSVVMAGLAAAPALYAHDSKESGGSMMGSGMMGQGGMGGMMNMMGQMSEMMEGCSKMMQSQGGSGKPNEQWREGAPDSKGRPGTNG